MNTGAHTPPRTGDSATEERSEVVIDAATGQVIEPDRTDADASASNDRAVGERPLDADADGGDEPAGAGAADEASADEASDEGTGGEPDTSDLHERLSQAEARADDNWDRLLRLQADMENQRKRAQRDVTNARKFALEGIVGDLLPVRDSLEMGLAAASEEGATPDSLREGADLTLKMLASALEKHNIVAIDPVGEKFNPEFHQAMSMQPVEGYAPNTVVSVMQKGYTLNERLVRPALVMVAK